jgi:guanylate kinase
MEDIHQENSWFIVVSAPSGTGKTSICRKLMKMYPELHFSVSHTTRPPRADEMNGRDYHFVTEESFRQGVAEGAYAEWAENYGYLYGTPLKNMASLPGKGFDLLLDIEPKGAKALKEKFANGIYVFILPPSIDELRRRIQRRGSESDYILEQRITKAIGEIREAFWYNYIIFNDHLDDAVQRLQAIYLAEKCRTEKLMEKIKLLFPQ